MLQPLESIVWLETDTTRLTSAGKSRHLMHTASAIVLHYLDIS